MGMEVNSTTTTSDVSTLKTSHLCCQCLGSNSDGSEFVLETDVDNSAEFRRREGGSFLNQIDCSHFIGGPHVKHENETSSRQIVWQGKHSNAPAAASAWTLQRSATASQGIANRCAGRLGGLGTRRKQ